MSTNTINLLESISPENLTDDVKRVLRCIGDTVIEKINDNDESDVDYEFPNETSEILILGDDAWGVVTSARVVDGHLLLTANYGDEGEFEYCLTGHSGVNATTIKNICIPRPLSSVPVEGKQATITFTKTIAEKQLQLMKDTMTVAIEGGINYWAEGQKFVRDDDLSYVSCELRPNRDEGLPFEKGDVRNGWQFVGAEQMEAAMLRIINEKLCAAHIREAVLMDYIDPDSCRGDAETADAIVQIALFGEIVFG